MTTTTRTRMKLLACIIRTVTSRECMNGVHRIAGTYSISFHSNPRDSVRLEYADEPKFYDYTKAALFGQNERSCFFGLHKDDPFLSNGINDDEAADVLQLIADKYVGKYQWERN